ncbi:hypothetical protein LINPERPRIM_LOCUS13948 [Linum perenne]
MNKVLPILQPSTRCLVLAM